MRLGAYDAVLDAGSRVARDLRRDRRSASATATATRSTSTIKRQLEEAGLRFSGMSPDGVLPEIVEIPDHPWFIGVQFHPELKSKPVRAASAVHLLHRARRSISRGWSERCRSDVAMTLSRPPPSRVDRSAISRSAMICRWC